MSNLAIAHTAANVIRGLAAGQAVSITLPNGTVVNGVPSLIADEVTGETKVQIDVSSNTRVMGAVEARIRVSPEGFMAGIEKAASMVPRIAAMEDRMKGRLLGR